MGRGLSEEFSIENFPVAFAIKVKEGDKFIFERANSSFCRLFHVREAIKGKDNKQVFKRECLKFFSEFEGKVIKNGYGREYIECNNKYILIKGKISKDGNKIYFTAVNITDFISEKEKLKKKLNTDYLTKAFTRRYGINFLKSMVYFSRSNNVPLSVLMLDIDNFKPINDKFGHICGDYVLRKISQTIKSKIRSFDVVIRYGGEEFLIVLPFTNKESAAEIAERIRKAIEDSSFNCNENTIKLTVSIGACQFDGDCNLEDLIKKADENLYMAKREGKNRVYIK